MTHQTGGSRPGFGNVSNPEDLAHFLAARGESTAGSVDELNARMAQIQDPRDQIIRFNWTAPLVMSHYDPQTLFLGGNYLFKTTDAGNTWTVISPDLTRNDPVRRLRGVSGGLTPDNSGAEQHNAITTFSESPISPRVLWVGTDDGNVQVTRDGGANWTNVRANVPGVPDGIWVGRIEASHFEIGEAYLTFDGHRSDTFTPWIFKTTDFGETWLNITSNIPDGHVTRVIRQDLRNPDLLFAGTEFGLFISIDDGESWSRFMNGMPTVPIYDLVIHPRDNDLIAGTHGRSIFILDDITPLQQLTRDVRQMDAYLFEQKPATMWENVSRGGQRGHAWYAGENPATIELTSSLARARFRNSAQISLYVRSAELGPVTLEISDGRGNRRVVELEPGAGIRRWMWDLRFDPQPLAEEEMALIDELFRQRIGAGGGRGPQLEEAYEMFRNATSDFERARAALAIGFGGGRGGFGGRGGRGGGRGDPDAGALAELRAALRIEEGGAGTYFLRLTVAGESQTGTRTVRPDPILNQ